MARRSKLQNNKPTKTRSKKEVKSYKSLIYGAITVALLFLIVFLGLRTIANRGQISESAITTSSDARTYVVAEGDNLWSISEKLYNDGYQWTKLAEVNKIQNPDKIEKGTKLTVPEVITANDRPTTTISLEQITTGTKITGTTYLVKEGDNLWDISVRAYGDGYKWSELAKLNKIQNPDLIYPGDKIALPR